MNALELRGLEKHYKDFKLGPLDLTLPGGTVTILGRDNRTDLVHTKEDIGVVLGSDGIPQCLNAVQVGRVMAGIYHNWDAAAYAALCKKI